MELLESYKGLMWRSRWGLLALALGAETLSYVVPFHA